jgi:hypothetical protein
MDFETRVVSSGLRLISIAKLEPLGHIDKWAAPFSKAGTSRLVISIRSNPIL